MVALIPFVTISQKRVTKGKTTQKSESPTKLKSNFMIIKGVEMIIEDSRRVEKFSSLIKRELSQILMSDNKFVDFIVSFIRILVTTPKNISNAKPREEMTRTGV